MRSSKLGSSSPSVVESIPVVSGSTALPQFDALPENVTLAEGPLSLKSNSKVLGYHLWSTRWVVLSDSTLSIYKDYKQKSSGDHPIQAINLDRVIRVERSQPSRPAAKEKPNCRFNILLDKDQLLEFRSYSTLEKDRWIGTLTNCRRIKRKNMRKSLVLLEKGTDYWNPTIAAERNFRETESASPKKGLKKRSISVSILMETAGSPSQKEQKAIELVEENISEDKGDVPQAKAEDLLEEINKQKESEEADTKEDVEECDGSTVGSSFLSFSVAEDDETEERTAMNGFLTVREALMTDDTDDDWEDEYIENERWVRLQDDSLVLYDREPQRADVPVGYISLEKSEVHLISPTEFVVAQQSRSVTLIVPKTETDLTPKASEWVDCIANISKDANALESEIVKGIEGISPNERSEDPIFNDRYYAGLILNHLDRMNHLEHMNPLEYTKNKPTSGEPEHVHFELGESPGIPSPSYQTGIQSRNPQLIYERPDSSCCSNCSIQ